MSSAATHRGVPARHGRSPQAATTEPLETAEAAAFESGWAAAEVRAAEQEALEASLRYRRDRAADYRADLGVPDDNDPVTVLGDVVDALIKWTQGETAELEAMLPKIAAVKARRPKPS